MKTIIIALLSIFLIPNEPEGIPSELIEEPKEEIEIVTSIEPIYSDDEIELLAKTVAAESANQGYYGQRLVAGVVLTRVESEEFPDTITGVITDKGQFESYPNAVAKAEPNEETYQAVNDELADRMYRYKYFRTEYPHSEPFYKYLDHYFNK